MKQQTYEKRRIIVMKKAFAILLTLTMALSLLAACGGKQETPAQTEQSAQPAALSGTVSTNGSTSMEKVIGALSEQFMTDNSGVSVTYDATGSGAGIEAASNGSADIGLSSRALKDEEKASGLVGTTVALDGIAVIVNPANKVADLTVEQIAQIFTGEITDWSQLGGTAGTISCIGREAGSGTRDGFESITGTKDACKMDQELTSTGAVIEAVAGNPNAIGYASLSALKDSVKAVSVNGVTCSEKTVLDGTYEIQRPFVFVTRDGFESITGTKDACKMDQELTSTGAVIEAVAGNPNAIGYASLSALKDTVKAVTVGGVVCSEETVLDGSYEIQRPFVFVTKDGVALSAQAQAFFDFATSSAANDLIRGAGAVPVA